MHDERTKREYNKWGQPLPEHIAHGTDDEIRSKMTRLIPHTWQLKGNELIGMTKMGPLVQRIPTNYILLGSDDEGLPVFKILDTPK